MVTVAVGVELSCFSKVQTNKEMAFPQTFSSLTTQWPLFTQQEKRERKKKKKE